MGAAVRIFLALTAGVTISHFHRSALSVIAPDLVREVGLSAEEFGVVASGVFLGIALAQIPTGILLDRFGARITIPAMQMLAVAGTLMFAAADSFTGLFIARVIIGIGFASAFMGGLVLAVRWFPRDRFTLIAALFLAGSSGAGNLLGATPLAAAAAWVGWRWAFVLVAALTFVVAVIAYLVVRDAPPGHLYHARKPESLASILAGLGQVLRTPRLPFVVALAMVGYPTLVTIQGAWGGPYLHDVHGLEGIGRGNVLSVMAVSVAAGLLLYGALDRYVDSSKGLVVSGALVVVVMLSILAFVPRLGLWQVATLFALIGLVGPYYVANLALGRSLFADHMVGRGMTVINLGNFIGVAVMQVVTGLIVGVFAAGDGIAPEIAYRLVFAYMAAVTLLVALCYSRIRDSKSSEA